MQLRSNGLGFLSIIFTLYKSKPEMPIHVQKWLVLHAVMLFLSGLGTLMVIGGLWEPEFYKTLKSNFTFCRASNMECQACRTEASRRSAVHVLYSNTSVLHCFCWFMSHATRSILLPGRKNVLRPQRNAFKETF